MNTPPFNFPHYKELRVFGRNSLSQWQFNPRNMFVEATLALDELHIVLLGEDLQISRDQKLQLESVLGLGWKATLRDKRVSRNANIIAVNKHFELVWVIHDYEDFGDDQPFVAMELRLGRLWVVNFVGSSYWVNTKNGACHLISTQKL